MLLGKHKGGVAVLACMRVIVELLQLTTVKIGESGEWYLPMS